MTRVMRSGKSGRSEVKCEPLDASDAFVDDSEIEISSDEESWGSTDDVRASHKMVGFIRWDCGHLAAVSEIMSGTGLSYSLICRIIKHAKRKKDKLPYFNVLARPVATSSSIHQSRSLKPDDVVATIEKSSTGPARSSCRRRGDPAQPTHTSFPPPLSAMFPVQREALSGARAGPGGLLPGPARELRGVAHTSRIRVCSPSAQPNPPQFSPPLMPKVPNSSAAQPNPRFSPPPVPTVPSKSRSSTQPTSAPSFSQPSSSTQPTSAPSTSRPAPTAKSRARPSQALVRPSSALKAPRQAPLHAQTVTRPSVRPSSALKARHLVTEAPKLDPPKLEPRQPGNFYIGVVSSNVGVKRPAELDHHVKEHNDAVKWPVPDAKRPKTPGMYGTLPTCFAQAPSVAKGQPQPEDPEQPIFNSSTGSFTFRSPAAAAAYCARHR